VKAAGHPDGRAGRSAATKHPERLRAL
jgi:hypothetical protein